MRILNSVLALFIASSVVTASPVALEKRADNGNVVVVTVTESITRTTYTAKHKVTRTVTVHAAMGEPMQRPARVEPTTTDIAPATPPTTVEIPTPSTPSTPSTPVAPAPIPATTSAAVVVNDASAASTSTPSSGLFSGQGTFYSTGLGSCGITSADTDYICAISHGLYDSIPNGGNPNNSPFCGRQIRAFRGGKSVLVKVVDRCEGCAYYDLDFSPSAFDQLASESEGRVDITWEWVS